MTMSGAAAKTDASGAINDGRGNGAQAGVTGYLHYG